MKHARILLASAAVALLTACGTDPVAPSGPSGAPDRIKPRHIITVDSTSTGDTVGGDALEGSPSCVDTIVVAGVPTVVDVCEERGPTIGSGN